METLNHPIVLFDGVCNFCEGSVRFIIDRDPEGIFRFASLQSEFGKQLAQEHGSDAGALKTFMLVQDGKLYKRTSAALRVAARLKFPWPLASAFLIVPPFIRDVVYRIISKNRYRWFGKKEACMIPSPEIRERFLG